MDQISRGILAKKTGVNAETVRYYEKAGLMPDPQRTMSGYRVYEEADVRRLSFIRRCRELGFTIDELRGLLSLVDGGDYSCAQVLESAKTHLSDIRMKIRDLQKMERTLKELSNRCSGDNVPDCPIVDTLWNP